MRHLREYQTHLYVILAIRVQRTPVTTAIGPGLAILMFAWPFMHLDSYLNPYFSMS